MTPRDDPLGSIRAELEKLRRIKHSAVWPSLIDRMLAKMDETEQMLQARNDEVNDLRMALQMFLDDGQSALTNPKATAYARALLAKNEGL